MSSKPETEQASRARGSSRFAFFEMRRSERLALAFLILFSIVAFLPVWRDIQVAGMSLFGWLMAALMLISPALMLIVFRRGEKSGSEREKGGPA